MGERWNHGMVAQQDLILNACWFDWLILKCLFQHHRCRRRRHHEHEELGGVRAALAAATAGLNARQVRIHNWPYLSAWVRNISKNFDCVFQCHQVWALKQTHYFSPNHLKLLQGDSGHLTPLLGGWNLGYSVKFPHFENLLYRLQVFWAKIQWLPWSPDLAVPENTIKLLGIIF